MTVESFFQNNTREALIEQVAWLQKELEVSDEFFLHTLRVDAKTFHSWRTQHEPLPKHAEEQLTYLWQVILHILSFLNFDLGRVKLMLAYKSKSEYIRVSRPWFDPPWAGTSMKAYLEADGPVAIEKIDQWVQGIRFADSY